MASDPFADPREWRSEFEQRGLPTGAPFIKSLGSAWCDPEGRPDTGLWAVIIAARWSGYDIENLLEIAEVVSGLQGKVNMAFQFFNAREEVLKLWSDSKSITSTELFTPIWLLLNNGIIIKERKFLLSKDQFIEWYFGRA